MSTTQRTQANPKLKQQFNRHVRGCKACRTCQLFKKQRKKYRHLPPTKEAEELPWSCVNIDLIGPYVVCTSNATYTLRALTMINPVTGWFEVTDIADKNANTVMEAFNSQYVVK